MKRNEPFDPIEASRYGYDPNTMTYYSNNLDSFDPTGTHPFSMWHDDD